ncbi:MAG: inositol monophosphatase [Promicromonosporaceae bacterium]|nr:inositol monophosphatase [Promicromonosporaceae bacterium]
MRHHDLSAARDLAEDLAVSAGALIRERRPKQVEVLETKSSKVDPVTEMDQFIENYLVTRIRAERPLDGILGEEGDDIPGTSGLTWVIDPIDGTVNYLYGVASCAVSVALVAGPPDPLSWQPLAAAVHAVDFGRTWTAATGQGATADGAPIRQNPPAPLSRSLVATGFGYAARRREGQARVLLELLPHIRDIRRLGSAAIDLCLQAEGAVDLYYERGLSPWDFAAGALIASEAGSTVCGLRGARPTTTMVVAGRGEALTELLRILEAADADDPAW